MPNLLQIWVRSQHPPTHRNLRGGRCSSSKTFDFDSWYRQQKTQITNQTICAYTESIDLKRFCHHMDNFFVYKIKSVLSLHAPVVLNILVGPLGKILNTKVWLLFWKHIRIPKLVPEARSKFFSGLQSLSLVSFLHVITSYWTGENSA